jgi:3-oxoacyl-[acyl-carrier protein] reductase
MIDPGLAGRVVLITGANSGIGAATARAFARQGAVIALHYLDAPLESIPSVLIYEQVPGRAAAEAILRQIRDANGRGALVPADLRKPTVIPEIFDLIEAELGPVEVLVNNAAHCEIPDTLLTVTPGGIDRHFVVNTRAPVLLMREFCRRHQARGGTRGRIINVSTDAARAFATEIAYGASKAALEAFTRSIACEVGHLGITVNAVAPGPVQTGYITDELEAKVLTSIPLGRIGTVDDIADAIVFFASEQARWITGQVVQIAGGHAL